jgi:hypothetical protein
MPDDPTALEDAYDAVSDALDFQHGATYEPDVDPSGSDEQIQLQKGCRALTAASLLLARELYGSAVELCFGAMERTLESYMIAELGRDLSDFQDHTAVYECAATHGPVSRSMARRLEALYANNRTDYYYDNAVSTDEIASAMLALAKELHAFVVDHNTSTGFERYCSCDTN